MLQLNMYNTLGENISADQSIVYNNSSCSCIDTPTNNIKLSRAGDYIVTFNCVLEAVNSGDVVHVALENNDVIINSAQSAEISNGLVNLNFSTILNVKPSCVFADNIANLKVVVLDSPVKLYLANIIIARIN